MPSLSRRSWVPESSENYVQGLAKFAATQSAEKIASELSQLTALNRKIYEQECFNLNPAGNAMNPRAEAFLAEGLGSRPSLGYPGDKYEMGLEAVEQIEAIAAELCAENLGMTIPTLVDSMDNAASEAFAAWPERMYIIDNEGKVHYPGGPGPFEFNPQEARESLVTLLKKDSAANRGSD